MNRLVFTTVPGLEAVAAAELAGHGLDAARAEEGLLLAPVEADEVPQLVRACNRRLRCVQRVGVRIGEGAVSSLDEVEAWARELDFGPYFEAPSRFAVRAQRYGHHDFHGPDLERRVGSAVQAAFEGAGRPVPQVDLTDPDALVRVRLDDRRIRLWLDTTGYRELHVRAYRRYAHMASMRPTVANLLLRLGGWAGDGTLVDPFCGSATIPIEAALVAAGVAPGAMRGEAWIWQRLPWLAGEGSSEPETAPAPVVDPARSRIVGLERFPGHLQGGAENAALAGLLEALVLAPARAEQTDRILAGLTKAPENDRLLVVTNPPFGRRVGFTSETRNLYRNAAAAWARAGARGVATIAEGADPMQEALQSAGFEVDQRLPVRYGALRVTVFLAGRK